MPLLKQFILFCLHYIIRIIVILSTIVLVSAAVECTNVACPNWTYGLCAFVIFLKVGFVDIVPLCCTPSISACTNHNSTLLVTPPPTNYKTSPAITTPRSFTMLPVYAGQDGNDSQHDLCLSLVGCVWVVMLVTSATVTTSAMKLARWQHHAIRHGVSSQSGSTMQWDTGQARLVAAPCNETWHEFARWQHHAMRHGASSPGGSTMQWDTGRAVLSLI